MKISIPIRKDRIHYEQSEELILESSGPLDESVVLTLLDPISNARAREQIEVSIFDLWRALRALKGSD